jgi:uncharacterized membrane protein SpoIIM required for sporulation
MIDCKVRTEYTILASYKYLLCKLILNNLKVTPIWWISFFTFLLLIAAVMLLTAAADIDKKMCH